MADGANAWSTTPTTTDVTTTPRRAPRRLVRTPVPTNAAVSAPLRTGCEPSPLGFRRRGAAARLDRATGEGRDAPVGVRAVGCRLLRPEHRASVLRGEAALHERQSALGDLLVEPAGGGAQRGGEVPGVHGQLRALPVQAGVLDRTTVVAPGTEQVVGGGAEGARRVVPGGRGRRGPVDP